MFLVWLSVAQASKFENTGLGTVHGWTADGALVLEVVTHDGYMPPTGSDASDTEPGTLRYAVVLQGGKEIQRWLVARELPSFVVVDRPLQTAEWTTWRAAHPVTPAVRQSATGARLAVRTDDGTVPSPKEGGFTLTGDRDAERETLATVGLSNAGEGFWTVHRQPIEAPPWSSTLDTRIDAFWSADGRQVAVLVEKAESQTMRGPLYGSLDVIVSRSAPLVAVLSAASVPAGVTDRVAAAVGELGLVEKGPAQAAREASVVYFASGWEADAKAIAARIPGGATVAPMDWKAAQHVVVAVGASAR